MVQLALTLFDGFAVTLDGEPVMGFDSNKVRSLLAYLAVESARAHRRESLAALLWPGYPDRSARTNLRNALANLRTAIGDREAEPPFLLITRETLQFNRASGHWLDVEIVEETVRALGDAPIDQLVEAAELYQGDFLAGFTLEDAVGFDDWGSVTGERLRRQALELLGKLVDRLEAAGDAAHALVYARRRVELEPWLETAQRELIRLLAGTGQRSAALRQYRSCVRILEEELGAAPSAETSALYERIRAAAEPEPGRSPAPTLLRAQPAPAFLDDSTEPLIADRSVFVGRAPELARLAGYLDATLVGQGQVAFVVGGPGRGKSSLMRAFAEQAMAAHPDLLVVSGACNATSGVGDAYLPFREALEMLTGDVEARWRSGTVTTDRAQRLWQAMPGTLAALVEHGPYVIGTLVRGRGVLRRTEAAGLDSADWVPELYALSNRTTVSGLEQQALFQQVTNTLQAVSAITPILLVLDDLQWADPGSIGLLFHLGRRLAGNRMLVLGAYRPEEVATGKRRSMPGEPHPLSTVLDELKRQHGDVWIDLRQADEVEGECFVHDLVDTEPNRLDESFRSALLSRTGGHPLFTAELLRAMQDRGDLILDAVGAWVVGESLDWAALPARVEAVIGERLSRLTVQQLDLLTVASVEGETFTAQVIADVQDLDERTVFRTLTRELRDRHRLVREQGEVSANGRFLTQFAFVHALFREHLYGELSRGEARLLHGEVAASLEGLYGDQDDRIVVPLARHYDEAGNAGKAVEYAARAGEQARSAYADDGAIRYYELALSRCKTVKTSDANESWRLAALSGLGKLYFRKGDVPRAEGYLRKAIALGRDIGLDPQTLVLLYHWLGEILFHQGRYEERCRVGEEGLRLVADNPRSLGAALMNQTIAFGAFCTGDYERGKAFTLRTAEFIRDLSYVEELMPAYTHIMAICIGNKDAKGVLEWVAVLEEKATQYGDLVGLVSAHLYAANYLEETGNLRVAIEGTQKQLETIARSGDTKHESWGWGNLAWLYRSIGDVSNAEQCAEKALELNRTVGFKRDIADGLCMVGRVVLCQGQWSRAIEYFSDAIPVYEAANSRYGLAWAHYLLGRAYLGAGQRTHALRSFSKGMQALPEVQSVADWGSERQLLSSLLSGLEEAYGDTSAYLEWCARFKAERPRLAEWAPQLCLAPVEGQAMNGLLLLADDFTVLSTDWLRVDPFDDCGYQAGSGLEIRATNGRDLWALNLSAPRLMGDLPSGAGRLIVQVVSEPALDDRPAIGGLLLWRDEQNYLWLELGRFGTRDIVFGGCLDNQDLFVGRGRLPDEGSEHTAQTGCVVLRLVRNSGQIGAFCSLDGEQWYSVGHTTFPVDDTVQVGVHAIGMIDRRIYHGAYPEGSAIRFREFRVWGE